MYWIPHKSGLILWKFMEIYQPYCEYKQGGLLADKVNSKSNYGER